MKKIRVFDSPDDLPRERSSLLAVSNKYGLTFVGQGRALKVFVTDDIIAAGKVSGNPNEIGKIFIIKKYEMIVRTIFFFFSLECVAENQSVKEWKCEQPIRLQLS